MAVRCNYCGEELLGSVNRCWKCGRQIQVAPGKADIPPVRRPPVTIASMDPAQEATVVAVSAEEPAARPELEQPIGQAAVRPQYPQRAFSESCAITSVVVGVLTAFMALLTVWSLIPAFVGVLIGAIGIGSRRQRLAIVGIVLCGLVFLISSTRIAVDLYGSYQQRQQEVWDNF